MSRVIRIADWSRAPTVGVLVGGLLPALTIRGPCFGLILGLACFAPAALVVDALARRSEFAGRARRSLALGAVLAGGAALMSYLVFRPPSGARILREHLGLSAAEVRDVRSWADLWGPDPAYAVRFRIDAAVMTRVVHDAGLVPEAGPSDPERARLAWRASPRMPAWWTPQQAAPDFVWTSPPPAEPTFRCGYDPESGVAYLLVLYH